MARRVGHSSRSATAIEDTIYLRNLCLSAVVGLDAWGRPGKSQPVIMRIQLHIDTTQTGISDDLKHSFSYGQMCKDIITAIDGNEFRSILELMSCMGTAADLWPGQTITGHIVLPKAFLRVSGGLSVNFVLSKHSSSQWNLSTHELAVKGIEAACIIGINPHERLEKQAVSIDLIATMKKLFVPVERWQALVKEVLKASFEPFPP